MGQKCKQKASLLICIWKILIFLLWIHIVGPYRLFWNNRLICGGNMWVAAVVQKIPLGISIRPQFIMLWKIMGAFLRQILLPIFTANITRFLDLCLGSTQLAQFCQNKGHFNYPWLPFVEYVQCVQKVFLQMALYEAKLP